MLSCIPRLGCLGSNLLVDWIACSLPESLAFYTWILPRMDIFSGHGLDKWLGPKSRRFLHAKAPKTRDGLLQLPALRERVTHCYGGEPCDGLLATIHAAQIGRASCRERVF